MKRSRSSTTWESARPYVVYLFDEMTGPPSAFGPYRDAWAALKASEVLRREIEGSSGGGCPPLEVRLIPLEHVDDPDPADNVLAVTGGSLTANHDGRLRRDLAGFDAKDGSALSEFRRRLRRVAGHFRGE